MAPKAPKAAKPGKEPKPQPPAGAAAAKPGLPDHVKKALIAGSSLGVVLFLLLIVMAVLFVKKKVVVDPTVEPMAKLRGSLAGVLSRPEILKAPGKEIAIQVKRLPDNIIEAQKSYEEKRKKYQSLFHKVIRRSSSAWKLHGRNLYYISKGEKTWYDAEDFCKSRDSHLVSILSDEEQDYITSQLQRTIWIGLTDEDEEGTWKWTDGSRLHRQYWSEGEPSSSERYGGTQQDCTSMVPSTSGRNWNDANCHKVYGWICKESLDVR